jgi:hypothetical protein
MTARLIEGGATSGSGFAVREIGPTPDGGATLLLEHGERLEADAVVVATPAFVAGDLLCGVDGAVAADLRPCPTPRARSSPWPTGRTRSPIRWTPTATSCRGPRRARSWPAPGARRKWAGRAPAGWALLRVFVGRYGQEGALSHDDGDLLALARAEVEGRLGARGEPGLARVRRWPRGMPQYLVGHGERVARIEAAVGRHPWLALAGNAYRGVGIPDCIARARRRRNGWWLGWPRAAQPPPVARTPATSSQPDDGRPHRPVPSRGTSSGSGHAGSSRMPSPAAPAVGGTSGMDRRVVVTQAIRSPGLRAGPRNARGLCPRVGEYVAQRCGFR